MTRPDLIMAIEERISILIDIQKRTKGLTSEGLPLERNSLAFQEYKILKEFSTKLQELR